MKNFIYQKIEYPNTTFAPIKAKNDTLTVNNREIIILCGFMTHSIMIFCFYTAKTANIQIILNSDYKISCICSYIHYICNLFLFQRDKLFFCCPRPPKFGYIMRYDVIVGRRYDRCEAIYQHLQDEWKYAH